MKDFDEGLKPSSDNLAAQIKEHREFVYIFKNQKEAVDKIELKSKRIYSHPVYYESLYKKKQLEGLNRISKTLDNTFLIGLSAVVEAKKIGELGYNWDSLDNIIKDEGCTALYNQLKEHFDAFYSFWGNKVNLKDDVEIKYSLSLKDHQKTTDNFKDFNPSLMGEKINEFASSLKPYTAELNKGIELLNSCVNIANEIEIKVKNSEFKENLEKLKKNLENNLNTLLNARVAYSRTISGDFESKFSDFLEKTSKSVPTDRQIISMVKKSNKRYERTDVIRELLYSIKSQEEEFQSLSKGIDLMSNGEHIEAKKEFEKVIKLNDKNSKARYFIGLDHLRRIVKLEVDQKKVNQWYDNNVERAINEFEKANEYSVAETSLYQSKNSALLALSRLLCGDDEKNLLEIVNTSIELSDNSLSRLVKAKLLNSMYLEDNYSKHLEDILENLNFINEEDFNIEMKELLEPGELPYEKAKTLLLLKRTKEDIPQIKELLGKALDENKHHILSHVAMSDVLLWEGTSYKKAGVDNSKDGKSIIYIKKVKSPYKKEALKHITVALKLTQNDLKNNAKNPEMVSFLLKYRNYDQPYNSYMKTVSDTKGKKIKNRLEEMKENGAFRKIKV